MSLIFLSTWNFFIEYDNCIKLLVQSDFFSVMNESVAFDNYVDINDTDARNNTWQWYKEVVRSWLEDPGVQEHEGLNLTALKMDQAYTVGLSDKHVGVYSVSDDCFRVS